MIPDIIEHCICEHKPDSSVSLEEMMEADAWARNEVAEYLAKCPIK
jgi:1-deoxy-D-xylulose 5-phosphate reductoisomerase